MHAKLIHEKSSYIDFIIQNIYSDSMSIYIEFWKYCYNLCKFEVTFVSYVTPLGISSNPKIYLNFDVHIYVVIH